MNKSLLTLGIATLLASSSTALLASSVTIPNTFNSGEPAVAAEVNDNFTAVADGVNDNDSRINTLVGQNLDARVTTLEGQNLDARVTTLEGQNLDARVTQNETDIADLQSAGAAGCGTDMVAVGSLCVDLYEASVWSTPEGPSTGTQYGPAGSTGDPTDYLCLADGSDCGANAANPNPIYALSIGGVLPSAHITWYQAVQACANVGKRLPTTAEWQMAASGTPISGDITDCNTASGAELNTDDNPSCISSTDAVNMVGNVWELTADLFNPGVSMVVDVNINSNELMGVAYGQDFANSGSTTAEPQAGFSFAPDGDNSKVGFRCVR